MPVTRIEAFQLNVPKNTPKATPTVTALALGEARVLRIQVVIPAGHIGQTGFQIRYGGQQVIPFTRNAWVTSDGEVIDWDQLDSYPTGDRWQVAGYNLDLRTAHSFYFRFLVNDLFDVEGPPVTVAPLNL